MSVIAIVGCGPLGGAVAHRLALRDRVREVRLIDPAHDVARGKALDILQSASIDGFGTRVTAAGPSIAAAAGADVIVLADDGAGAGELAGESGLAIVRTLLRAGSKAPIVCAGASQRSIISLAVAELRVPRSSILGSAPLALESAVRALAALALDASGTDVSLRIVGVPPGSAVVAWEEAAASGQPLTAQLPAHAIAALDARVPALWPPGPYALGSAAARVAEALACGSRRRYSCFVALDAGPLRRAVAAMPVELERGAIRRIVEPALTRQERTRLENGIAGA